MRRAAYYLTLAFILSVPWESGLQFGPIGTIAKVLGVIAGAVWLLSAIARGSIRTPETFHKWYFLFLIWSGLTFLWTIETGSTSHELLTYCQLFLMVLVLWDLLDTKARVETAVQAYVLGAYVTSASIVFNYLSSPTARFPAHDRVNALGYKIDGIALIVAIALPAAWYLATGPTKANRPLALRLLNFAYIPFGGMALVLTGTRGATLASIPTAIFVLWSLKHASGVLRAMALAAVLCVGVLVYFYAPRGMLDRISTATTATQLGQQGGALSGRWSIWSASVDVWMHHPIRGIGVGAHRAAVTPILGQTKIYKTAAKQAHNTYVSVLTETGIVGGLLFLGVLLSVIASLRQLSGWQCWYWSAQIAVLLIDALSLSLEDSKSVWIFFSLAVAAAAAAREAVTEVAPAGPSSLPEIVPRRLAPVGR